MTGVDSGVRFEGSRLEDLARDSDPHGVSRKPKLAVRTTV